MRRSVSEQAPLAREVRAAVADRGVAEKLAALGVDPVAISPADFKQFVSAEIRKQTEAVRIAGIEPESRGTLA